MEILQRHGAGRPMHYRVITELAITDGLIQPRGITPEASMNAAITTEIRRRADSGEEDVVVAHGRGLFSLARHRQSDELDAAIRRNNTDVRERLHAELREMDPRAFEGLIGRLLTALGFVDVEVTKYSGDGGIDVRGNLTVGGITNVSTAIQVKRWANNVSGSTVRELRGGLNPHERGLIITTARFTRDAQTEAATAERAPISLVDGDALVGLRVEHDLGVIRTEARVLRLDPSSLLPVEDEDLSPDDESGQSDRRAAEATTKRVSGTGHGEKHRSLWPLRGGRTNYVRTMWEVLTAVSDSEPTLDQFVQWMIDTYELVKSRKTAKNYIVMVRLAGLIESREGRFALTPDGAAALASGEADALYRVMDANIAGIAETLERVHQSLVTPEEMRLHLNEILGTEWEVDAQAGWRLQWLESFGKIRRVNDRYEPVDLSGQSEQRAFSSDD